MGGAKSLLLVGFSSALLNATVVSGLRVSPGSEKTGPVAGRFQ